MFNSSRSYLGRFLISKPAPAPMEETKLMSEDEDVMPVMKARRHGLRIDLMMHLLSVFVFVIGILMVVSTLSYKQSDKSCAAQLSIWCKHIHTP